MSFKQFKENKIVIIVSSIYLIVFVPFVIWMIFIDENSYIIHRELNKEIDKLENANEYYKEQIEEDKKIIDNLNDPDSLEKYAREKYKMKKKNEDIYIIEIDSVE